MDNQAIATATTAAPQPETQATPQSNQTTSQPATDTNQVTFENFIKAIPETQREVFIKNGVKDFDTLHKSYEGLLQLKGKKGLIKPSDTAPEAEKKAYTEALFKEMGRPDNGEYDYILPEGVNPEIVKNEFVDGLADIAYKSGMSKTGFQELINTIYTAYNEDIKLRNAFEEQVKKKLGEDSMSDNSKSSVVSKDDLRSQAQAKTAEAQKFVMQGNYQAAQKLQDEARELIAKSF